MAIALSREENRLRILRAAEWLMAAHGIDGVSLREINRAAGQGNASAIQYHFGDREGLVIAVLERHQVDSEPRRHALLDEYEADGAGDLRVLARALVVPLVDQLADPDGGREYVQIAREFYTRARSVEDLGRHRDERHSMARWNRLAAARLPEQEHRLLPSRRAAVRLVLVEVARRAQDPPEPDDDVFASNLTDLVAALVAAPISDESTVRSRRRS